METDRTPEEFFTGHPFALGVFERVLEISRGAAPVAVRVSTSQVALRVRHGFASVWLPGQYLRHPDAEVVVSIALGRHVDSPRFKEVVHPSSKHWIHHLEVHALADLDDEVAGWLREAAERAG
ncbi:DUF5655 domain-containing protein [Intrasporangium calvum]|uniref:DUF5655 domain-containing protein n=1 Tax=Intrasporangium calvum TaxID=53358 RepID=UPI001F1D49F9|nr:DUF5655 domain-containing protein [Intrasporangium calvum]